MKIQPKMLKTHFKGVNYPLMVASCNTAFIVQLEKPVKCKLDSQSHTHALRVPCYYLPTYLLDRDDFIFPVKYTLIPK